jgi:hypothetical protein
MPVRTIQPARGAVVRHEHGHSPAIGEHPPRLRECGSFVSHVFQEIREYQSIEHPVGERQVIGRNRNDSGRGRRFPGDIAIRDAVPVERCRSRGAGRNAIPGFETERLLVSHNWASSGGARRIYAREHSNDGQVRARMELYSLHPLPEAEVATFLRRIASEEPRADGNTLENEAVQFWYRAVAGNPNPRPNDLSLGLAGWLASRQPVFARQGLSLSSWEARVDRGSGMLLRPPSRLFVDAGLEPVLARAMPIRIEGGDAMMGGAYVPARLMADYLDRLERHSERSVRRLNEAELDGPELTVLMLQAARYASSNGFGLYEAIDLLDGSDPGTWPPGARVLPRATDRAEVERIRQASLPPKEPGLIARLLGRRR